jgi:protein-S-isoprenylcysteine O-methyltransferase
MFPWLWGALLAAWIGSETLYARCPGGRSSLDRGSSGVMLASLLANVAVVLVLIKAGIGQLSGPSWPHRTAGLAMAFGGVWLRVWAIRTLGRFFTSAVEVAADHSVIASGPFRWLRHPGYAGVMLFGCGMILALGSWAGALVYLFAHGQAMHYRITVEERALQAQLREAYVAYCARTWRMCPFVY